MKSKVATSHTVNLSHRFYCIYDQDEADKENREEEVKKKLCKKVKSTIAELICIIESKNAILDVD